MPALYAAVALLQNLGGPVQAAEARTRSSSIVDARWNSGSSRSWHVDRETLGADQGRLLRDDHPFHAHVEGEVGGVQPAGAAEGDQGELAGRSRAGSSGGSR
jgi:hypothetical protein